MSGKDSTSDLRADFRSGVEREPDQRCRGEPNRAKRGTLSGASGQNISASRWLRQEHRAGAGLVILEFPVDAPDEPPFVRHSALGQIAQLVEQRTENPRVLGSIPSLATTFNPLRFIA